MSIIIYLLIFAGISFGFFRLFPKAGKPAWAGLIPGYNIFVATQIIEKPWWWMLLFLFPGVNVVMLMVVCHGLARRFGRHGIGDVLMSIFLPFGYLAWLGGQEISLKPKTDWNSESDRKEREQSDKAVFVVVTLGLGTVFIIGLKYLLSIKDRIGKPTFYKEWGDSIVFAIIAAAIIRTYVFEAFTIPTGSMEKTLLIGDYLFVSKMAYGPKVPQTPLSFPLAHHSFPWIETQSYLEWMHLPYFRLPGFGDVERNDIVVFNYPEGDTVLTKYQSNISYNRFVNDQALQLMRNDAQRGGVKDLSFYQKSARKLVKNRLDYVVRPVDKRENYIKRCVAVPGDEIFVDNGKLMINGETANIPVEFQQSYILETNTILDKDMLKNDLDINYMDQQNGGPMQMGENAYRYMFPLTLEAYELATNVPGVVNVNFNVNVPEKRFDLGIFPNNLQVRWTQDFWGPLTVPQKGTSVDLTLDNLAFYSRIIEVYEGHKLDVRKGQIMIDGEAANSYTFEMDYYFMMGDSRHNSADSRFWGFVPEDHVVGRAAFVWLSLDPEKGLFDGKLRFDRMFSVPE